MKIVLLGYMGSGKSTVGKALSQRLDLRFIDQDAYIEEAEGSAIPELFESRGEIYFRKKEHHYLSEILDRENNFVLSTGGGTPCYGKNMETILRATDHVVYLKLSINALVERLLGEKAERPLISNIPDGELPEFIGKHLFERSFYYNQAKQIILCDGKDPQAIVEEIALASS